MAVRRNNKHNRRRNNDSSNSTSSRITTTSIINNATNNANYDDNSFRLAEGMQHKDRSFSNHILVKVLSDTSKVMSGQEEETISASFLFLRWVFVISGIIGGGFAVCLLRWIISTKILEYSTALTYTIASIVILIGPDFFPPIVPMMGCEEFKYRVLWTLVFCLCWKYYWYASYFALDKVVWTISGVWNFDRGDADYVAGVQSYSSDIRRRPVHQIPERELEDKSLDMLLTYFRAASGIGMLWAAHEIYSSTVFYWGVALFFGAKLLYFLLTGIHA